MQARLHKLLEEYKQTPSLDAIMELLGDFIINFTMKRLSSDPDICSEFYLEVYSCMPAVIKRYDAFPHKETVDFVAYLATSLRHEFMNFIRKYRRRTLATEDAPVDFTQLSHSSLHPDFVYHADDTTRHRLSRELSRMDMACRLPTKLYFGMELGMDELEVLLECCGEPISAANFLRDYRQRRAKNLRELRDYQDRLRRVNHKIHMLEHTNSQRNKRLLARFQHRKQRLMQIVEARSGIYKFSEIANLLKISRSSVMRRIHKAKKLLQHGLRENQTTGEWKQWTMESA